MFAQPYTSMVKTLVKCMYSIEPLPHAVWHSCLYLSYRKTCCWLSLFQFIALLSCLETLSADGQSSLLELCFSHIREGSLTSALIVYLSVSWSSYLKECQTWSWCLHSHVGSRSRSHSSKNNCHTCICCYSISGQSLNRFWNVLVQMFTDLAWSANFQE